MTPAFKTLVHHATSRKFACSLPDVIGIFSIYFTPHYGPEVDSYRNEHQESYWGIKHWAKGWQHHSHLWADYLENVWTLTFHNPTGFHDLLQE
jgi:hypothetical protein